MWWSSFVGFGVGLCLSYLCIFPAHVVDMRLVHMTVGDLLRILGGLLVANIIGLATGRLIAAMGLATRLRGTEGTQELVSGRRAF